MSWWIYAAVKTGGRESVGLRMVATHRAIAYLVFDSRESCLECSNKIFFFRFHVGCEVYVFILYWSDN